MSETKRLVLLTGNDIAHRYVANILCNNLNIERIVVDQRAFKGNLRRAAKLGPVHFINKAARSIFLRVTRDEQAKQRALKKVLGEASETFSKPDLVRVVDGINSPESVLMVREIDPSAILVFGTSVVRGALLGLARDVCFNMHTGISPYYRGTGCSFWPVVNGDLDMLGATIHKCTDVIDGGVIYEIAHARYRAGDDLHTLFARSLIAGADAYGRVIRRYLEGELTGVHQDLSIGREYRGSELTLGPELKARFRLWRLARHAS
jgi:methionyl-tRNA formyltransferase